MANEAAKELRHFLDEFRETLEMALDEGDAFFTSDFRPYVDQAWRDSKARFEEVESELRQTERGARTPVARRLSAVGLEGSQLRMKLYGFRTARRGFKAEYELQDPPEREWRDLLLLFPVPAGVRRALLRRARNLWTSLRPERLRRRLKPVLKWANVILDSLSVAVPPAKLLQELKQSVEAGVDDRERRDGIEDSGASG